MIFFLILCSLIFSVEASEFKVSPMSVTITAIVQRSLNSQARENELSKIKENLAKISKEDFNKPNLLLSLAAYYADREVIDLLLKNGIAVNAKDIFGYTALYQATRACIEKYEQKDIYFAIIEKLLKASADMTMVTPDNKTPLDLVGSSQCQELIALFERYYVSECAICLEPLKGHLKYLDCGHSFHRDCIKLWFKNASTCPICRYSHF